MLSVLQTVVVSVQDLVASRFLDSVSVLTCLDQTELSWISLPSSAQVILLSVVCSLCCVPVLIAIHFYGCVPGTEAGMVTFCA